MPRVFCALQKAIVGYSVKKYYLCLENVGIAPLENLENVGLARAEILEKCII